MDDLLIKSKKHTYVLQFSSAMRLPREVEALRLRFMEQLEEGCAVVPSGCVCTVVTDIEYFFPGSEAGENDE